MNRLLAVLALVTLIAATPEDALSGLERDGFYIEPGSSASEQVVSDAVFDGRADGGRLYIVVLAEEPSGGATTFSDSMLDLLGGAGYVVTVAPETVGFAGDGSLWTADEMNSAIDDSLNGGSDDAVVEIFIDSLTGEAGGEGPPPSQDSGGLPWGWILLVGGVAVVIWAVMGSRRQKERATGRLEEVKRLAKAKLDDVANDILEMETEVALSENQEVKEHYQRASAMYSRAIEDTEKAATLPAMLEVSEELDLAIWELDCAEALLDGKPKPEKPKPVSAEPVVPPPPPGQGIPSPGQGTIPPAPDYDRRPERHSSGSNDLLTVLMTMMAMGGMRGPGGFGGPMGGWGGGGRFGGGGGGRIRGGGGRFGGGRIRGGGRRG
ncbi:MAG TPA: hypothetical protein VG872_08940 [Acidimicrobiia bacterium]|jgi:hypothetical protein|nr:hypothetical protein [Acidimicrobiia bacterium]